MSDRAASVTLTIAQRIGRAAAALYDFTAARAMSSAEEESMDAAVAFLTNHALGAGTPEPPSDDLAALIAECEERWGWWKIERKRDGGYFASVFASGMVLGNGHAATALAALRAANQKADAFARQAAGKEGS